MFAFVDKDVAAWIAERWAHVKTFSTRVIVTGMLSKSDLRDLTIEW